MVFLQLGCLLKSNECVDANSRSRRVGRTGKEGERDFALLRGWGFVKGSALLQSEAQQISDNLFQFAALVHRAEFNFTHEIVGQINRCFHKASLLVFWHSVKVGSFPVQSGAGPIHHHGHCKKTSVPYCDRRNARSILAANVWGTLFSLVLFILIPPAVEVLCLNYQTPNG